MLFLRSDAAARFLNLRFIFTSIFGIKINEKNSSHQKISISFNQVSENRGKKDFD